MLRPRVHPIFKVTHRYAAGTAVFTGLPISTTESSRIYENAFRVKTLFLAANTIWPGRFQLSGLSGMD